MLFGVPIPVWIILLLLFIACGYESDRRRKLWKECMNEGHLWRNAGMGDHPDARIVCNRCGAEV